MKNKPNPTEAYYMARERLWEANDESSPIILTTRVKNSLEKTLKNNRRPAASARLAVWEQRQQKNPYFQKSNSSTPHILSAQKGKEGSALRVYLERAFSDPEDYLFPVPSLTQEQRKEALKYIIMNPSRIPDSLFLEMSGIDLIDWMPMSAGERMEKKRSYIPLLKELFFESFPLMTRYHTGTGRIVRLPFHSKMPKVAGSYLVFQEISQLDHERISQKESRNNVVTTKIIPDIWSLARSQSHAIDALSKKIDMITDSQNELVGIRVDYSEADEAERKRRVEYFMLRFAGKQGYAFKKILSVRKPKLKYTNAGIDDLIFQGMYNDLEKYMLELASKRSQIQRQEYLLRNMAKTHKMQFTTFFEVLRKEIQAFDSQSLEEKILQGVPSTTGISFSPNEAGKIGKIWNQVRQYGNILLEPSVIGTPFFEVESRVVQSLKTVKKSTPQINMRELYKLVEHTKITMCQMLLYELQDLLSTGDYQTQKESYDQYWKKSIESCESFDFLHRIKSEKLDHTFQQGLSKLKEIYQCMQVGDIEAITDAVKAYPENLRTFLK